MPSALQYGMSVRDFWYGDPRLLVAYKIAYTRNTAYLAWYIGNYSRFSMEIGAKNALITKKSDHIDDWITFKDPTFVPYKEKITAENLEEKFRESQARQSAWIQDLINR